MVQEERCLLNSYPTLGAGVQSPARGQPMTTGNYWPAWLRRHKVVTALIGTTMAAASLLAVIKLGDDSKSLLAAARSARAAAESLVEMDRLDEAEHSYKQARMALEKVVARWPGEKSFRRQRAEVVDAIGVIEAARDQLDVAEATDQEAIGLWAMLVAEDPTAVDDRLRMEACINRLGLRLREAGRWEEAEVIYLRGRRLCENLPPSVSNDPRIHQQLAVVLAQLGQLLLDMGRRLEALACYASAVKAQEVAVDSPTTGTRRPRISDLAAGRSGSCARRLSTPSRGRARARPSGQSGRKAADRIAVRGDLSRGRGLNLVRPGRNRPGRPRADLRVP